MDVKAGDHIEIHGKQVGSAVRRGEVTEVVAERPLELRVTWDDGHETVLYPSGGNVVIDRAG